VSVKPPFRAEQVGSLLRPPELLQARTAHAQGRLSIEELRAAEDSAIVAALEKQHSTGIDIYTDGEMRRSSWLSDMAEAVEGFIPERVALEWKGPGGGSEASTAHAAGARLRKTRKLTAHELPFLKQAAPGPFKITVPSPSNFMLASYKRNVTDKHYARPADLLADIAGIVHDEVQWLQAEGVPYIQFDAPYYSYYFDPLQRERLRAAGLDPDRELEAAIAGDNARFEATRAVIVVLEQKGVDVQRTEKLFRDCVISAFGKPAAAAVPATDMEGQCQPVARDSGEAFAAGPSRQDGRAGPDHFKGA
jgi:5-methyltetrahydropteroyltriglutamate--homocysteine methyltransferase